MTVAELVVKIGAETTGLQKGLRQAEAQMKGFKHIGNGMASVGASMSKFVTLPILAAAGASTKLAIDFEDSMNHVQALTGASKAQVQTWSNAILSNAQALATTPNELAQGLYFVASAGVKMNQVWPITAASAKAAAAGMGDTQTVAQLLTSAINAYGPKALSAAQATDALTAAVRVGKAEPADFAKEMGKVIPQAQAMGVSFQQAAGMTAELTNTGLDAAQATTSVRAIMTSLIKPTAGASKALKSVGMSAAGIQQEVRQKGLLATLIDLKNRFHGNRQELAKVFPNVRALTGVFALTGKNAGAAAKGISQVEHSAGSLNKAFAQAKQDPMFKLKQSLAGLEADAIKIGVVLIPIVTRIADTVTGLANAFSHLSPGMQRIVGIALAVAAAVGPLLFIMGKMIILGYQLSLAFTAIGTTGLVIFGVVAAVIAVGVALVILYKKSATFRAIVNAAFNAVKVVANAVANFIRAHWRAVWHAISTAATTAFGIVKRAFNVVKGVAGQVIDFIRNHWRTLIAFIPVIGPILAVVVNHFQTFKSLATKALDLVKSGIGHVRSAISTLAGAAAGPLHRIVGFFQSIIDKVEQVIGWIGRIHFPSPPGWMKSIGGGIVGGVKGIVGATGGIVTGPTHALIAEKGPEAVIPLNRSRYGSPLPAMGGGTATVNLNLHFHGGMWDRTDTRRIARQLEPELNRIIKGR